MNTKTKVSSNPVAAHEAESAINTALCMMRLMETVAQGNEATDLILGSQDDKIGQNLRCGLKTLASFAESELEKALGYVYQSTRKAPPCPPLEIGRN